MKRKAISLRTKIFYIILLVSFISIVPIGSRMYLQKKSLLIEQINSKLLTAATSARCIVGGDYHDSITDKDSVNKQQYLWMVNRYNKLCLELNLQYLWSLMQIDEKIVFTSSTTKDKNVNSGQHALFFDTHTNPEAYSKAFETMDVQYGINDNEWGYTQVVLVPYYDTHGRKYLFGASIQVSDVYKHLRIAIYEVIGVLILMVIISVVVSAYIARALTKPISAIKDAAREIADGNYTHLDEDMGIMELNSLSDSINNMSQNILNNVQELESQNEELLAYQKRLDRSEFKHQEIFNATSDAILIHDAISGEILDVNESMLQMYGYFYDEVLKLNINDLSFGETPYSQKEALEYLSKAITQGTQLFEWRAKKKNGEVFWVEVALKNSEFVGKQKVIAVVRDITERIKSQDIMVQTEKMMTIGGLAAGMAHEINNPLTSIMQSVQNIIRRLSSALATNKDIAIKHNIDLVALGEYMKEREIDTFLQVINDSGNRSAQIVKNMLSFSRKSKSILKPQNINEIIDETLELASHDYDLRKSYDFRKIEVKRDYASHGVIVNCVKSEIAQVILNLIKNGAQAMNDKSISSLSGSYQPTFTIRTYTKSNFVYIEIEDNGPGMAEQIKSEVFNPFFTTKPEGKATGLGLSVAYFIITQNHKGRMWVESKPNEGARFVVAIPIVS